MTYSRAGLAECIGQQHRLGILPLLELMLLRTRLAPLHQVWHLYLKTILLIHFLNQKMYSRGLLICFSWPVAFLGLKFCCWLKKESRICLIKMWTSNFSWNVIISASKMAHGHNQQAEQRLPSLESTRAHSCCESLLSELSKPCPALSPPHRSACPVGVLFLGVGCAVACGILAPWRGIKPCAPPAVES